MDYPQQKQAQEPTASLPFGQRQSPTQKNNLQPDYATLEQDYKNLYKKLEETKAEIKKLKFEFSELSDKIASAKTEHAKFLEYEIRARKTLEEKDMELQKKQASVEKEENFLKNRRSFLLPM